MARTNLKTVPKIPPRHLTLEAARQLAYHAHVLAAAAIAWKRGVESLNPEDNAQRDDGIMNIEQVREDWRYLAAQASLDALAHQAKHVLESLREFREHDQERED